MGEVRQATLQDIPALVEIGRLFHAASPWKHVEYDVDSIAALLAVIVPLGGVWRSDDGLCGGALNPLYFNPSVQVAVELFWWAPSHGKELREAFEIWAKEAGASFVQCSALVNDRLGAVSRLYARAGYEPAEVAFVKAL